MVQMRVVVEAKNFFDHALIHPRVGIDPLGKKPRRYVPRIDVYAKLSSVVTVESGFMASESVIVTAKSGSHRKSITINRIDRSR